MKTLVIVDLQNDFIKGGSLEVPDGDSIVDPINNIINNYDLILATKDWHPKDHVSFASNHQNKTVGDIITLNGIDQVLWPDHCVQNTFGSDFPESLNVTNLKKVIYKGIEKQIDSYSGFFDNGKIRFLYVSCYYYK